MSDSNKSYIQQAYENSQINQENGRREWTNYDSYMNAQTQLTKSMQAKPALTCTLCGYPMDYKGHKLTDWEKKWSTHEVCKEKIHNLLDRESGIARERRAIERRNRRR